jgi:hypothetical protein
MVAQTPSTRLYGEYDHISQRNILTRKIVLVFHKSLFLRGLTALTMQTVLSCWASDAGQIKQPGHAGNRKNWLLSWRRCYSAQKQKTFLPGQESLQVDIQRGQVERRLLWKYWLLQKHSAHMFALICDLRTYDIFHVLYQVKCILKPYRRYFGPSDQDQKHGSEHYRPGFKFLGV